MTKPEWEKYGSPTICGSRWFKGTPTIEEKTVQVGEEQVVERHWMCPIPECKGEMIYTDKVWRTTPKGFHHSCYTCGFTAAIFTFTYPYSRSPDS